MKSANIQVECLDTMGSDLTVVNSAKVSFAKQVTELRERDIKLINYLAEHNHWSPFAHCFMSFRIKAPIFVARQLVKHQVGLAWNEESRRYINDEPEFWFPEKWRNRPENIKQGSGDETVEVFGFSNSFYTEHALNCYQTLLNAGVAPEQARMVLPLNTMTNWIWSGSLYAFARVCKLRLDSHAQSETQIVARQIWLQMFEHFPHSTKALLPDFIYL